MSLPEHKRLCRAGPTPVIAIAAYQEHLPSGRNEQGPTATLGFTVNVGPVQPGGGWTASPNGTIVPPASQIVDSLGNVWTIGANQTILRNGSQAAAGLGSKILWSSSTIYVLGVDNNWWRWTGSGWTNVGPTQPS